MHFIHKGVEYVASIQGFTDGYTLGGVSTDKSNHDLKWFGHREAVEVTCYYVHGEGSYMGDTLVTDSMVTEHIARKSGLDLDGFVNGCKFDMYDALFMHRMELLR